MWYLSVYEPGLIVESMKHSCVQNFSFFMIKPQPWCKIECKDEEEEALLFIIRTGQKDKCWQIAKSNLNF